MARQKGWILSQHFPLYSSHSFTACFCGRKQSQTTHHASVLLFHSTVFDVMLQARKFVPCGLCLLLVRNFPMWIPFPISSPFHHLMWQNCLNAREWCLFLLCVALLRHCWNLGLESFQGALNSCFPICKTNLIVKYFFRIEEVHLWYSRWKISFGLFDHVMRLDQSRASKDIWWIINKIIFFSETLIDNIKVIFFRYSLSSRWWHDQTSQDNFFYLFCSLNFASERFWKRAWISIITAENLLSLSELVASSKTCHGRSPLNSSDRKCFSYLK